MVIQMVAPLYYGNGFLPHRMVNRGQRGVIGPRIVRTKSYPTT